MKFLMTCCIGVLVSVSLADAAEPDRIRETTSRLESELIRALGETGRFVDGQVRFEPTFRNRYWLAKVEARKAGDFVFEVALQESVPRKKNHRDVRYRFPIRVARKGTPRVVSQSLGNVSRSALACVGDEIVIPIRINARDRNHSMTLKPDTDSQSRSRREMLKDVLDLESGVEDSGFQVDNGVEKDLPLIGERTNVFSNMSSTVWYHSLQTIHAAVGTGEFTLRLRFSQKAGNAREAKYHIRIVKKDKPVTVIASNWQMFWTENGKTTRRGRMGMGQQVAELRVGDRLLVSPATSVASPTKERADYPTIVLTKLPFNPSDPFVESLPARNP